MTTSSRNYSLQYIGSIAGVLSIILYIASAAFSFLSDAISMLFAFAFPLLWIISFMGLYKFLSEDSKGVSLQIALVFGVIGSTIACTFLVIQQGNLIWYEQLMQDTLPEEAREFNKAVFIAVDKVQGYMDIVFDIFITLAWILFGLNIAKNPHFNRIIGYVGTLIALGLLVLNLYTFPFPPANSGLFDLGPFLGIWAFIFYLSFFLKVKAKRNNQRLAV